MSQQRSAGVSIRQYRISAARWRCSRARSSFPSAGTGAIAAPITALLLAFPLTNRARSRAFRRARGGGIWAQGGVSGDGQSLFAVTGNTFGTTGWFGATEWSGGEAVLRLSPTSHDRSKAVTISPPRIGVILIVATSTSNGTAAIPFDVVGPNGARKLIFA